MPRDIWFKNDPLDLPASVLITRQSPRAARELRALVEALADGGLGDPDLCMAEGHEAWLLKVHDEDGDAIYFHCYSSKGVREKTGIEEVPRSDATPPREPPDVWLRLEPDRWQRAREYLDQVSGLSPDDKRRWHAALDAILSGRPIDPALGRPTAEGEWQLFLPTFTGTRQPFTAAILDVDPHWADRPENRYR
jgi:hypothetical protein